MSDHGETFRAAIVAALPGFLEHRLAGLGAEPGAFGGEVTAAVEHASGALADLLAMPYDLQLETPFEVVRRSLAPLAAAVEVAGLSAPDGDGETTGLAPASAAELGDEALEASIAWGLAKTGALSRPTLLVVTASLMDGFRFESAASSVGYRVEMRRDTEASVTPLVAYVDLEHEAADDAIRSLAANGVRVIAYGPHVDDHALVRAKALGAAVAEPRSRMFRNPAEHLRPLV
jgi:hypothetical protein